MNFVCRHQTIHTSAALPPVILVVMGYKVLAYSVPVEGGGWESLVATLVLLGLVQVQCEVGTGKRSPPKGSRGPVGLLENR